MIERLVAGIAVSAIVSVLGWRAGALSGGGAIAATLVGTAIVAGTSWAGALTLGTFFVLSSLLSKLGTSHGIAEKGSRRDAAQVFANGGVAALGALVGLVVDERLGLALVAGSLAAATADTWATEIGSTSRRIPRLILSRRPVRAGESGGITSRGTLAAFGGAVIIGAVAGAAGWIWIDGEAGLLVAAAGILGGIAGTTVDSLAGELVQERRHCPVCAVSTEARRHHCGVETTLRSGVRGVTNDVVNVLCTTTGAAVGLFVLLF